MGIFSKKDDYMAAFARNDKVLAAYDLPGVPERTAGVVRMVNGFEWQRYLVFFDNGVQLGSLDRSALVRPKHWHRWSRDRQAIADKIASQLEAQRDEQEELLAIVNADAGAGVGGADGAAGDADGGGASDDTPAASDGGGEVSEEKSRLLEMLPEHLRERSQLARARLGG